MPQMQSMAIPTRLPLIVTTGNRDHTSEKDARLVNCYMETDSRLNESWIIKRPGIQMEHVVRDLTEGLGCTFWEGHVYSIFGDKLFRDGDEVADGLNDEGGKYEFSSILGATHQLLMNNGKAAYAYDEEGGLSDDLHSINVEYPEDHVKGWAYLNGAVYVQDPEAVIWGSAVNDVTSDGAWDPLNFISAQMNPDKGMATNQQHVYVIAFNQWSTEVFYDVGNPQGSPLANAQGSKQAYGCANADSIQRIDDVLFWLSTNESAQVQVAMMENQNVRIISSKSIDRLLGSASMAAGNVMSWQLKMDGHTFYAVTVKSINKTLVYDWSEGVWHQWADRDGNYFPIIDSTHDGKGNRLLQHESDGRMYRVSNQFYKDGVDIPIIVDIVTPVFDGQTRRRKHLGMLEVVGDQQPGSMLTVSYSDDDYQTWSNPRLLDMAHKRPRILNCGTFSKRAFHFRHERDTPLRIMAIEVQFDLGTL